MNTMKYFLGLTMMFAFIGLNAQERYLTVSEYPNKITSFITSHFSKSEIISIKEEKEIRKTEYEVKLNSMEELEFDEDFTIKKIESKTGLPNSVLSDKVISYVAENYANKKIVEWKRKRKTDEIELDNDLELVFDKEGNFLRVDD